MVDNRTNMITVPEGFQLETRIVPVRKLIVVVTAMPGTGKTHFALTAPDPIAYYDMDTGTAGVIEKFVKAGKKIYRSRFDYRTIDVPDPGLAVANWERQKATFKQFMHNEHFRSVVVDTGTEMWELLRMARLGKLTQVMPHNYGPVNAEFEDLLRLSDTCNKNLIVTHKMKEQYINDKFTGKYQRAGFKDMGFIAEVELVMYKEDGEFCAEIKKCRHKSELEGFVLTGDMVDFQFLESMIFD